MTFRNNYKRALLQVCGTLYIIMFPVLIDEPLRSFIFSDTGDPAKLNELGIKVIGQQTCTRQWQSTAILNTHICVGDGETGG